VNSSQTVANPSPPSVRPSLRVGERRHEQIGSMCAGEGGGRKGGREEGAGGAASPRRAQAEHGAGPAGLMQARPGKHERCLSAGSCAEALNGAHTAWLEVGPEDG
jgi:hypothetical protein